MSGTTIIEDLYSANEWAMQRMLRLCERLSDERRRCVLFHGTHHRAQLINMLRHSGATASALDYGAWVPSQQIG